MKNSRCSCGDETVRLFHSCLRGECYRHADVELTNLQLCISSDGVSRPLRIRWPGPVNDRRLGFLIRVYPKLPWCVRLVKLDRGLHEFARADCFIEDLLYRGPDLPGK